MRSWIARVAPERAEGRLAALYARLRGSGGAVDTLVTAQGLRPHSLEGHLALQRSVLHHRDNTLPRWLREALGVYVSLLNRCDSCAVRHADGLRRLVDDPARADTLLEALEGGAFDAAFTPRERAALAYARRLTLEPDAVRAEHVEALREAGFDDGEVLELVQLVAYFAYLTRIALGLGVSAEGVAPGGPSDSGEGETDGYHV